MMDQTILSPAATAGKKSTSVPNTVNIDTASTACLVVSDTLIVISAVPRLKALVYTAVRVFGGLGTRVLGLHPRHPCAEGLSPCCVLVGLWLGGGGFQSGFSRIGLVVRGSPFGVQAALWVLALFARPCFCLSHGTLLR